MHSNALAALDSLATTLVPKLPAASQLALAKTAHYYYVQKVAELWGFVAIIALLYIVTFVSYKYAYDETYNEVHPITWILGAMALLMTAIGIGQFVTYLPFLLDPTTGTILELLGK